MTLDDRIHAFWRSRAGRVLFDFLAAHGPWLQVALLLVLLPIDAARSALREP